MQFVSNGPDIPERLLQLHEDGRVVFFCGAGISYPARLPGFSGLVERLYGALAVTPNAIQQAAISAGQFDTAIGLLEADVVGKRETVRKAMAEALIPDLSAPNATVTHEALLTLGRNRDGRMRLITTNFDRLFEHVATAKTLAFPTYQAPLLPVPKARWDGLVYLHGLLSSKPTSAELDRLVISSGDFGLAYLTERWAARFVSELFRGYTVCFVGYSINDPVLRYMMDALAADRLLGESPPEMFAFGSYSKGKEKERANEWKAKNVTPILYREHRNHAYLHKTLRAWAETYRDGVRGKERIVVECAIGRPLASTKQDDFVGRMLWALSDSRALPAKRFSELDPVPSLDWLEPLSEALYKHSDLVRFGVPALPTIDEELAYSLIQRPAPYTKAPWMMVAGYGSWGSQWDQVMQYLAAWLVRHLDDPKLLLWLVKRGGQLHAQFIWLIERRLDELAKLEQEENSERRLQLLKNAPRAIPRASMRTLWRLLLNGRVKSRENDLDLYRWREQFDRDGLQASVRLALREALAPYVTLREPFRWEGELETADEPVRIKGLVEWEIKLASHHVHSGLRDLPKDERWESALPNLLNDFSGLLVDALDLMRELGGVDSRSDYTYIHQPSISEHPQNKDFHDWTALIELSRDAWLATARQFPKKARVVAEAWSQVPYPVFTRLAFFAATHEDIFTAHQALDFLLKDNQWWMWSIESQREVMRLLVRLGPRLDLKGLRKLERAILLGPPRKMFQDDISAENWTWIVDHSVWLRLAKIENSGVALGDKARVRYEALRVKHPEWQLAEDQRDEFPSWMESGWGGNRDPWMPSTKIPRTRRGTLDYLLAHPVLEESEQDDWKERCSESLHATAYALFKLSQQSNWPVARWRHALQAWSEDKWRTNSWRWMAPVLVKAPEELLQVLASSISWWLQSIAKTFQGQDAHFLDLANRLLELDYEPEAIDEDPVFRAINHPIGHVTQALLDWWYRQDLEDDQGLPDSIKTVFSKICDTDIEKFKHGRLLLAAHVITLFRVDRNWAEQFLLPLFDWTRSEAEARAAWEGYLWSPRLYRPMMEVFKVAFLDTARNYTKLGKHARQYSSLLTFAALDLGDTFSNTELAGAVRALPPDGLREAADTLVRALEGAGDQREEYWRNRILPFWEKIWPKSNDRALDTNTSSLARLAIAAGNEFSSAISKIGKWLQPIKHPDYVIHRLLESGLCSRSPEAALELLRVVLDENSLWIPPELRQCLNQIIQQQPELSLDRRYLMVDEIARRVGI